MGQASGSLNNLLETHITLDVPSVEIYSIDQIRGGVVSPLSGEELSTISLGFDGTFTGVASLIFPKPSATKLVSILLGDADLADADIDSIAIGTRTEVGNIILNGVMGSIANVLKERLKYRIPSYAERSLAKLFEGQANADDQALLIVQAEFKAEVQNIQGNVV